jgi:hypothetical protein
MMMKAVYLGVAALLIFTGLMAGCGGGGSSGSSGQSNPSYQAETVNVTITVRAPDNTPGGDTVWMRKGIYFGSNEEEVALTSLGSNVFRTTITAPKNSILRYRYSRGNDFAGNWDKEESYVYRNGKFRNRELLAKKDLVISETIAKWEDLDVGGAGVGVISGTITSSATTLPVMGLIISAGPFQTRTNWDGTYQMFGVPAGPCAVTIRADNGEYVAQVTEITVPANGIATRNFTITPATMTSITFNVTVPGNTPSGAQVRLFGDTYHLGMFPSFEGTAVDTSKMRPMTNTTGSVWTYTATLGEGTCFQYLYTLGDYRINQERDVAGVNVARAVIASGSAMTINDTVTAWKASNQVAFTFDIQSPTSDTVYVTSDGWGGYEPLMMWPQGSNRWKYVWYVDPNQTLKYKYIRNGDPAIGVEELSPDTNDGFREIVITTTAVITSNTITKWRHQLRETLPEPVTLNYTGPITDRASGQPFQTGIEFIDYWRSAWTPLIEPAVERITASNARWAQIASVWGIVSIDPPIIEPADNSFLTEELVEHIRVLHNRGLKAAIRAFPYPDSSAEEAAFTRSNTNQWYDGFYAQVKKSVMYNTKIAKQENVEMLILANFPWLDDTTPVTATYINQKWKDIIAAVRAEYPDVKLTVDYYVDRDEYDWYGDLDYLGDQWWWQVATDTAGTNFAGMKAMALQKLQDTYLPRYQRFNKPFIFTELAYYSADTSAMQQYGVYAPEISDFEPETSSLSSNWQEQADAYEAVLWAFAETPWVQGVYSFGYSYSDHDCKSYSIRGKTAEQVLKQIYGFFPQ